MNVSSIRKAENTNNIGAEGRVIIAILRCVLRRRRCEPTVDYSRHSVVSRSMRRSHELRTKLAARSPISLLLIFRSRPTFCFLPHRLMTRYT
ncbi:hypothetical protein J6590_020029 [Homalodisca vitripennis]|nr:hypothetical protein J6590_020029 [Homalodisca vitripennis]